MSLKLTFAAAGSAGVLGIALLFTFSGAVGATPSGTGSTLARDHQRPGGLGQGSLGEGIGAGGHKVRVQNGTSTNWAGWVDTGASYTTVSASWRQPTLTCAARETSYSSFWVGLDGDGSSTVEQTGTEADCVNGTASYSAWYEFYPAYPVYYGSRVRPGDLLSATVSYSPTTNLYTAVLTDSTGRWTHTTTGTVSTGKNVSAEVIAEAPASGSTGQVLPLADFGAVTFSAATVNGVAIGTEPTPSSLSMVTSAGVAKANTSALLNSNAFSVTWASSGVVTPPRRNPRH